MIKTTGGARTAALSLIVAAFAGVLPPHALAQGGSAKTEDASVRQESPELAEFKRRLGALRKEESSVLSRYAKKQISRAEAREQLLPLIEAEDEIQNDKNYKVEMRLHYAAVAEKQAKEFDQLWANHERMQNQLKARQKAARPAKSP
jgi:hypothetical protein